MHRALPVPIPEPLRHTGATGWRTVWRRHWGWVIVPVGVLGVALALQHDTSPGCHSSEISAISTLRNVDCAQRQFQSSARIDIDGDGIGEFGTFGELSGALTLRGGGAPLVPALLSGAFRAIRADGTVHRSSYSFRLWFFDRSGVAVSEPGGGGLAATAVEADSAERGWICYAWPVTLTQVTRRTFVVDAGGDIFACSEHVYHGATPPHPSAAIPGFGPDGEPLPIRDGGVGLDGNVWVRVH